MLDYCYLIINKYIVLINYYYLIFKNLNIYAYIYIYGLIWLIYIFIKLRFYLWFSSLKHEFIDVLMIFSVMKNMYKYAVYLKKCNWTIMYLFIGGLKICHEIQRYCLQLRLPELQGLQALLRTWD